MHDSNEAVNNQENAEVAAVQTFDVRIVKRFKAQVLAFGLDDQIVNVARTFEVI